MAQIFDESRVLSDVKWSVVEDVRKHLVELHDDLDGRVVFSVFAISFVHEMYDCARDRGAQITEKFDTRVLWFLEVCIIITLCSIHKLVIGQVERDY